MTEIPKIYEPKEVEQKWYSFWMEKGYFHAEDVSDKPPYTIVIPPPNITGALHKGHAVPMTLQDILIRWKRMQGYNTLWMPGTDHAGISANAVVDRQLREQGLDRFQLGREKFIEKMWEWKHYIHKEITERLKRLGCSLDWERERFTLDDGLSKAVMETFVRLYNEELIYRSHYIVNWCPRCRTTLSNLEVDYNELKTSLYYVSYPYADGNGSIVVATTRPETMLGDTGVAVHPSDERYKNHIGKNVILPIVNREIPIVADGFHVDPEFGTGAVKVTPGHDFNDFEVAQRQNLPSLNVLNDDATMNENAGKYQGMDRFECRKALLKDLEDGGYLVKIEEHEYMLGKCSKCETVVEPRLSLQWFVKMKPLAEPAIKAVENGDIRIIPESWTKIYYEWMYNIRDWPISRQIWWGHRVPVWYCQDCDEMIVAISAPEKCKCGSTNLEQDPDVLDTWFSSGLWPFSTLGWPEDTQAYRTFYPNSVLVTGWDILFFWVARMIFQGIGCTGKKPFNDVYLHPLIADDSGAKMSKSKGNVLDLLNDLEKFGTDAFRFAIAASITPSSYMTLPENRIQGYRNFANKIWNASRFVLMNLEGMDKNPKELKLEPRDRRILTMYNSVVQEVTDALDAYRFSDAAQLLYEFVWHEYCDWYLERVKDHIRKGDAVKRQTAQYVLWYVLEGTLRLLHPIMPFITEEIWQHLPYEGESIMIAKWPKVFSDLKDKKSESDMKIIEALSKSAPDLREKNFESNMDIITKLISSLPQKSESDMKIIEALSKSASDLKEEKFKSNMDIITKLISSLPQKSENDMDKIKPLIRATLDLTETYRNNTKMIMELIGAVRNIRSEFNVPPSSKSKVIVNVSDDKVRDLFLEQKDDISHLVNASTVEIANNIPIPATAATMNARGKFIPPSGVFFPPLPDNFIPPAGVIFSPLPDDFIPPAGVIFSIPPEISVPFEVSVDLAGLIDIEKEKDRLTKNLDKAISDLERIEKRLADEEFMSKAPENIVAKERERKAEIEALREKLEKNLGMLE
jgi:valyl-tRNA synthetase